MDLQESLADDSHLEPDEYARLKGLSVDSQVQVSLLLDHFQRQSNHLLDDNVADDDSLTQLRIPRLISQVEQLDGVSRESLELLSHAASLGRDNNHAFDCPPRVDFSQLKLESPLLRSDPEYDCRELARSMQQLRRADVDLTSVPLEPLNVSNDESLDFPEISYRYKQMIIEEIRDEKIDITKEALIYLSRMLKDVWTSESHNELLNRLSSRRVLRDLALTPPLSPYPQNEGYFIPEDVACQVPLSSDNSTLLDDDLTKAEADLLREDDYHPDIPSLVDLEPLTIPPSDDFKLPGATRLKIDSIKVEGPLSPLNSIPSSSELAVDMVDLARCVDIDHVLDKQRSIIPDAKGVKDPNGIFSDDVMTAFVEKAKYIKRSIEQEKLQAADAMARIEIPTMDFSIPDPNWKEIEPKPASQLAWIERTYEAFNVPPWPKDTQAERALRWFPFPSKMGHVSMNEIIVDDGTAKVLLNFSGPLEVPTSGEYVWKQPGLAILREWDDDDEEEQELPYVSGEERNIESLVRKRRLELNNSSDSASPVGVVRAPQATGTESCQTSLDEQGQHSHLLLGCNDASATSTLLSNYLDFHIPKRQKNMKSSFFPTFAKEADDLKTKVDLSTSAKSLLDETLVSKPELEREPAIPAPCPPLQPILTRTKIIKALTLERGVLSRLEKSHPNIEIIERDFDRWNSSAWNRNSVSRSPITSPLAAEADVIVSPATGIVIITLLRAIQKPPPGQKGVSKIRERIRSVALRYERLIILVSEGNRVDETARSLTPAECAGYADFVGFTTGLDTNVQVYYVGGGDDTLVKWLVFFLVRHAPDAEALEDIIIQEESLWELFLRRAGMNAYAAQAILGQLKAPDDIPEERAGKYGLPAFIRMAPKERVQAFQSLMGGERVLNRVNETLETQWG
ncbi:hypothetical protein F5Y00DRAFT_256719 [Daldinia vernicosa]|uniref:uncharacterized protein n=1 Tax=Daldinia vernicosa TaxID=114800 RepID=UPI0020076E87|nr:uncharacterized protein F5Y00DRAFT_256719 [Daldinia vernicosa]KAI0854220.1 hypothetical protein F5Y00DRAFT_256719 [Daldinia vernicosa]